MSYKQLTRGQKVEAGYFVYGGKAELGMQFVNVHSVDRKMKLWNLLQRMQVFLEDTWHVLCLERFMVQGLEAIDPKNFKLF